MKSFVKIVCIISICILCLSSCAQQNDDFYDDEQFQEGLEYGREDMFFRIYKSASFHNQKLLTQGDVWNTEHFSLILHDDLCSERPYIGYDITLKNTTTEKCIEDQSVFFNIFATNGEMVLGYDSFLWDGALDYDGSTDEYLKGNNAKSKCFLYSDTVYKKFLIIIATEGHIYCAAYTP